MAKPKKDKNDPKSATYNRTEMVGMRLDPKTNYLAELAARKHRRSKSSYIEWALVEALKNEIMCQRYVLKSADAEEEELADVSIIEEQHYLWHVDEADRVVALAEKYKELLSHEELLMWKVVSNNNVFWIDKKDPKVNTLSPHNKFIISEPEYKEKILRMDLLRKNWSVIKSLAFEEITEQEFQEKLILD